MFKPSASMIFAIPFALAACTSTDAPLRYAAPSVKPAEKVRISYRTVEVREVTLPDYAALSEMAIQTAEGGISTTKSQLWADNPTRAVTLELTRNLAEATGATVASDPWPFETYPEARVFVRVEEILATHDNQFKLSGQYFVGPSEGEGKMRARIFRLSVPIVAENTGEALVSALPIAAARAQIISDLALLIAKDGLT